MQYSEFLKEIELAKKEKPILFQLEQDKVVSDDVILESEEFYGIKFAESYKQFLKVFGGGYFGYIILYSLDSEGMFYLRNFVTKDMIKECNMLPVIDLETGDYIGFDIEGNECTENLITWSHDEKKKSKLNADFYEVLATMGLENLPLNI